MSYSREKSLLRRLLIILVVLVILAAAVLVWALQRRSVRQEAVENAPRPQVTLPPELLPTPTAVPTPTPSPSPTPVPTPSPTPEPTPPPVELGPTDDGGQEYVDQLVFLGDGTTYGLAYYDIVPQAQVWTPAGGTLTLSNYEDETVQYYDENGVRSLSITEAVAAREPRYLVMTLGVDGISFMDQASFHQYYTALIRDIRQASPGTNIICNSIFPVIDSYASVPEGIDNEHINAANEWICAIAEETGTRYLNTHDSLTDGKGDLRYGFTNGDGIHLSTKGFNAFMETVRTHMYQ